MIVGIGMDMIEIRRVAKACEKHAFFTRCFSVQEQELIQTNMTLAADNFATKEAVVKVFGTGFHGCKPNEIEVLRDELGKPFVVLYGKAKKLGSELGIKTLHVSITNTKEYASAFAVGED